METKARLMQAQNAAVEEERQRGQAQLAVRRQQLPCAHLAKSGNRDASGTSVLGLRWWPEEGRPGAARLAHGKRSVQAHATGRREPHLAILDNCWPCRGVTPGRCAPRAALSSHWQLQLQQPAAAHGPA